MKLTLLVVMVACLMGALLALTMSPHTEPEAGPELVAEQPILEE